MGTTFANPTYFYEAGAKPDLVDTNGPIYARSPVCVGKVTPYNFLYMDGGDSTEHYVDIKSHDLYVLRETNPFLSSSSQKPKFNYKLNGVVNLDGSIGFKMSATGSSVELAKTYRLALQKVLVRCTGTTYCGGGFALLYGESNTVVCFGNYFFRLVEGNVDFTDGDDEIQYVYMISTSAQSISSGGTSSIGADTIVFF